MPMRDLEDRSYTAAEVAALLDEARKTASATVQEQLRQDPEFREAILEDWKEKELPKLLAEARAEERKRLEEEAAALASLDAIKPLTDEERKAFREQMAAGEFDLEKETLRREKAVLEEKAAAQGADQDQEAGKKKTAQAAWTPATSGTHTSEDGGEEPATNADDPNKGSGEPVPLLVG